MWQVALSWNTVQWCIVSQAIVGLVFLFVTWYWCNNDNKTKIIRMGGCFGHLIMAVWSFLLLRILFMNKWESWCHVDSYVDQFWHWMDDLVWFQCIMSTIDLVTVAWWTDYNSWFGSFSALQCTIGDIVVPLLYGPFVEQFPLLWDCQSLVLGFTF